MRLARVELERPVAIDGGPADGRRVYDDRVEAADGSAPRTRVIDLVEGVVWIESLTRVRQRVGVPLSACRSITLTIDTPPKK